VSTPRLQKGFVDSRNIKKQARGDDDRLLFVAPTHHLKEEVDGVGVVGEVADLLDREQRGRR
jgi:hypothetical protein